MVASVLKHAFESFESASVLLPVIDETVSLVETIAEIERTSARDVCEYLLIVCDRTSAESRKICREYADKNPKRFRYHSQKLPFLGGALREAFELARGSHVLMMASDLETDPKSVPAIIARAKQKPSAIVTATRWAPGGGFEGYQPIKLIGNKIFQRFLSILFGTRLTDLTFGFRIFPRAVVQSIEWSELKHPFLLETLVKPLRLGVEVEEIASRWTARREGVSSNPHLLQNLSYLKLALRVRFSPVRRTESRS